MYRFIWALQLLKVNISFELIPKVHQLPNFSNCPEQSQLIARVLRLLDPRVVSGDFPLDKEPGDSGYSINRAWQKIVILSGGQVNRRF